MTTTTATSCPAWCVGEHGASEAAHEAAVAEFERGDLLLCRQPWGDHEVQLWFDGDQAFAFAASEAPFVLRGLARAATEAARRLESTDWRAQPR